VLQATDGQGGIAVELIGRSIDINGAAAAYHCNHGNVLRELGRREDALAAYDTALCIRPDYADAYSNRGNVLKEFGRLDDALAAYDAALHVQPDRAEAYCNRGGVLKDLGHLDDALNACNVALCIKPDFAEAHSVRGNVLKEIGRLDDALAACDAALRIKPDFAEAHTVRGNVLRELGRLVNSVSAYDTALCIKPDFALAHLMRGSSLADLRRPYDALAAYTIAAALGRKAAEHLAAAVRGDNTDRPPIEYVTTLFDAYASRFETHLVNTLKYRAPTILRELVDRTCGDRRFARMADLGCGTGLSGKAFQDIAREMIGIDASRKMIETAKKKEMFDKLIVGDIVDILAGFEDKFDLFVLTDVLIYFGSIRDLLSSIRSSAMNEACLAFTAESFEGEGFRLLQSARYAHSRAYLEDELKRIRATVMTWEEHPLRAERGRICQGYYIVAVLG
jgi:predicted TPR repeat methyltransferase